VRVKVVILMKAEMFQGDRGFVVEIMTVVLQGRDGGRVSVRVVHEGVSRVHWRELRLGGVL
jgi:hypothetical protein